MDDTSALDDVQVRIFPYDKEVLQQMQSGMES